MSQTISSIPPGSMGFMNDLIPLTQGSSGPGTGTTRILSTAQVLATSGLIYAADPQWVGGVKADGISDDTAAWNAAIAAASYKGSWVVAPVGVSRINSFTLPSNVGILGRSVESYTSAGATTLGSVIQATSTTSPGITLQPFSQISGLQISGTTARPCVQAIGGAINLTDVTIFGGSIGVDFMSVGGQSMLSRCRIYQCGVGIANCIWTQISMCLISSCSNHGILLSRDCNYNVISGNRIEWSGSDNIHVDGVGSSSSGNTITGNSIDASGRNNLFLRFAKNTSITGNSIGRAGRNISANVGSSGDANVYMLSNSGVSVTGNSMWVGQNDNNTGYIGPYYAIWDDGGNGTAAAPLNLFSGNILQCHNNSSVLPNPPIPINTTTTFSSLSPYNVVTWI